MECVIALARVATLAKPAAKDVGPVYTQQRKINRDTALIRAIVRDRYTGNCGPLESLSEKL